MTDLFAIELPLIQRLQTEVPTLRLVRGIREITEIANHPPLSPAAYVLPNGYDVLATVADAQAINQYWLILTTLRVWRENQNSPNERAEIGLLLKQIINALIGWQPLAGCGGFILAHGKPATFRDGFGSYPLVFSSRIILPGSVP